MWLSYFSINYLIFLRSPFLLSNKETYICISQYAFPVFSRMPVNTRICLSCDCGGEQVGTQIPCYSLNFHCLWGNYFPVYLVTPCSTGTFCGPLWLEYSRSAVSQLSQGLESWLTRFISAFWGCLFLWSMDGIPLWFPAQVVCPTDHFGYSPLSLPATSSTNFCVLHWSLTGLLDKLHARWELRVLCPMW